MKISNSKKQLAKIISENGGWREGSMFSAQDQDGEVFFYTAKPARSGGWWLHDGELCGVCIVRDEAMPNWHQTILSRDEYFHLYPAQDADGWIAFNGYNKPDFGDLVVEVTLRDGEASGDGPQQVDYWDWSIDGSCGDIISYRPHKPEQSKPEYCESVMRSIPEPEAKPSIEQLAADYRNLLDFAQRKQEEADDAKADADARLAELIAAGKAIGLVVSVAAPEPELIITSIVGLIEGDVIELTAGERYNKTECTMVHIDGVGLRAKSASDTVNQWWNLGGPQDYDWRFIRRP